MCPLGWLGVASLCLGTLWAVPAEKRTKVEKPKAELTLYENLDLGNYEVTLDNYGDILDLSNYEELYDYGDLVPKVRGTQESPRDRDLVPGTDVAWQLLAAAALAALLALGKVLPEPKLCQLLDVRIPSSLWARGVPRRAWGASQEGIHDPNL